MGYGLPGSNRCRLVAANGSKPVIAVMGDGSCQMDLPENGYYGSNGIFPLEWYCSKTTVLVWYTNISIVFMNRNYQAVEVRRNA